jgi:hypothetical protein
MIRLDSYFSFGVCGSRLDGSSACDLASRVVPFVFGVGDVFCGCASGVDAIARHFASRVFRVSDFGLGRWAFTARSVAFVRYLADSPFPVLLVFPSSPCPAGLLPSASSSRCFCGLGSGSWASCAFAVGLRVPVVVFGLPVSSLPSWDLFGSWSPVSVGGVDGFLFQFIS